MNPELQIKEVKIAASLQAIQNNISQFTTIRKEKGDDFKMEDFVTFSMGKKKGFEFEADPAFLYEQSCGRLTQYLGDCILQSFIESTQTQSNQAIFLDKEHPSSQEFTPKQLMKILRVPAINIGGKRKLRTAVIEYIDESTEKTIVTGFEYKPFSPMKPLVSELVGDCNEQSLFKINLGNDYHHKSLKAFKVNYGLTVTRSKLIEGEGGYIKINTYEPSSLKPVVSKASPMVEHIHYLCDEDKDMADHLINWLAFNVQFPQLKIKHAVLLGSKNQGTGKSMLIDAMRKILGSKNTNSIGIKDIGNGKQNWLVNRVFIAVEEVKDVSPRQMNKLKSLITEETVNADIKFGKYGEESNVSNFLFTSNERRSLYLDESDRRYFVVFSEAEPQEAEYYSKLNKWLTEEGGINEFYGMLLTHDLSDFNPNARPPMTEAKKTLITNCVPDLDLWIREWCEERFTHYKSFKWDHLIEAMSCSPHSRDTSRAKYIKRILEDEGLVSTRLSYKGSRESRWHKDTVDVNEADFLNDDSCDF